MIDRKIIDIGGRDVEIEEDISAVEPSKNPYPISTHYAIFDSWQGKFVVNRHDPCIMWAFKDNKNEILNLSQYAHGIVLDIGANIGMHTIEFAKTAEHVFAFEPQPQAFFMLCSNLLLNVTYNVTPIQCALGAENGSTTMHNIDPKFTHSSAGEGIGVGDLAIALKTLDSLKLPDVKFIKIDVERSEYEVLKGAQETLTKYHPIVYVEIHEDYLIEPIVKFMESIGYEASPYIVTAIYYPDGWVPNNPSHIYGYLFQEKAHE